MWKILPSEWWLENTQENMFFCSHTVICDISTYFCVLVFCTFVLNVLYQNSIVSKSLQKMTLKDKKNKREYNRKLKAEGGSNTSNNNTKERDNKKKDTKSEKPSTNFTGVTESADKLITDANKRFAESTSQVGNILGN